MLAHQHGACLMGNRGATELNSVAIMSKACSGISLWWCTKTNSPLSWSKVKIKRWLALYFASLKTTDYYPEVKFTFMGNQNFNNWWTQNETQQSAFFFFFFPLRLLDSVQTNMRSKWLALRSSNNTEKQTQKIVLLQSSRLPTSTAFVVSNTQSIPFLLFHGRRCTVNAMLLRLEKNANTFRLQILQK